MYYYITIYYSMYDILVSKQESMVNQTELVKKKTSITRLNEPVGQHTRSNYIRRVTR